MENIYVDDWDTTQDHPGYRWSRMRIAKRLGGKLLGGSIYLIGPGQKSFPYHFHHANEEMLIVLEGEVSVRTPDGEQTATKGDALMFPTGPEGGHQLVNRTDSDARVLMMSTMVYPEVAQYPDSGNIGVFAGRGTGGEGGLARILDGSAETDYFEGS